MTASGSPRWGRGGGELADTEAEIFGTIGGRPLHKSFASAYDKGWRAAEAGLPRESPYPDKRGGAFQHVVTFSRAYTKYWLLGYDNALRGDA